MATVAIGPMVVFFMSTSDARIKNFTGLSNNATNQATLNKNRSNGLQIQL